MFGIDIVVLLVTSICIIGSYWHGEKAGIKKGADAMYQHLYSSGVRKEDKVIVCLEYEDRSGTKEF